MDVFYEESAIANNSKSENRKYAILNGISKFLLAFSIFILIFGFYFIHWFVMLTFFTFFFGLWFIFWKWKRVYNVSYDYSFVSGELRIAKVFSTSKRKLVTRFDCTEIIQMGDADNPSYDRFAADPTVKTVFCTPNVQAADGKFFMYILIEDNGKKLYVLECRELLLMNILKFVKRTTLESDYVMQEKKQK